MTTLEPKKYISIEMELKEFDVIETSISSLNNKYMPLSINGINDKDGYKEVRIARLDVKRYRVDVEKRRKELTADAVKLQKMVNEKAKYITSLLIPIEDHLFKQEEIYEIEVERLKIEKEKAESEKLQIRVNRLLIIEFKFNGAHYYSDYTGDIKIDPLDIKNVSDDDFEEKMAYLQGEYEKYKSDIENEEKKKKDALKKEEEERRAELEKINKIRQEQEIERARLDSIAKEQAEKERQLKIEQDKIEKEKARIEEEKIIESKILESANYAQVGNVENQIRVLTTNNESPITIENVKNNPSEVKINKFLIKLQELNESPEGVIEEYIWKIDTEFDKDFIERKISMVVGGLDEYFTERKISLKIE
ncbi:MAG: hypothetical protein AABY22_06490 [Nanoarchaeota archaeon]